ncbi:MAG: hypothetical protein HOJ35_09345 [Bdellovibrionales bacterium]|jgi:hypothetical protein|nr:hypothetical protein [Bdellovibrionales bacterium]
MMINVIKIFLVFIISLQLYASSCQEIGKIHSFMEQVRNNETINGDLSFLTHTPLFQKLYKEGLTPAEKTEAAITINGMLKEIKDNRLSDYVDFVNDVKNEADSHTQGFFIKLLLKCGKYVQGCINGMRNISQLNQASWNSERHTSMPELTMDSNGKLQMGEKRMTHSLSLIDPKRTPTERKSIKQNIVNLSDNLIESGDINIREGLGAVRAQRIIRERSGENIKLENSDVIGIDFCIKNAGGEVIRTFSLKGPFMENNLKGTLYEQQLRVTTSQILQQQKAPKKKSKLGRSINRLIREERISKDIDWSNENQKRQVAEALAFSKYIENIESNIKPIKKDILENDAAGELIVDLLGQPKVVQEYIKNQVNQFIAEKGIDNHKTQNIIWIE